MAKKFRLNEQDYRNLFTNASDAIWVHDKKGNVLEANKAAERLSGYSMEEFAGKNITQFLSDESLAVAREIRRKLLNGLKVKQPYEQRLIAKDGTTRIVEMSTSPIIINGDLQAFQHVARDVTKEKRLEQMLTKIIDGSPIPTFVIDKRHKITHWNPAIETLSGISEKEMMGTNRQWQAFYNEKRPTMADLIVDGVSADEINEYYPDRYEKSRLIDGAYEAKDFFPDLGGHGKWLHFTASPIKNEHGETIGAIETLQDITEEKQIQEARHFYVQLITRAQEEERKRISRELHDDVSPSILLLTQRIDAITSGDNYRLSHKHKIGLDDLRTQALAALDNLRCYAQDLRPRILDDLGLVAALEWMAEDMTQKQGIDTRVGIVGAEYKLPNETQLLLFRIAQEALSNIRKHAKASRATVTLEYRSNSLTMTVMDNGKGFELPSKIEDLASAGRLGIMGMLERVKLLSGTLEIRAEPSSGTSVVAKVPL